MSEQKGTARYLAGGGAEPVTPTNASEGQTPPDPAVAELVEAARGVRLGLLRGEDCTGAIFTRLTRALSPFTDHKEER
jgi:hypothetical protein